MSDTVVRRLTAADIPVMRAMLTLFGEVFEEPDTFGDAPPDDEWLAGMLAGDGFIAIAALDDDTVVGGLCAYVLPKYEQARKEVYIYDLAVADTRRRQGIATALIRACQREAREAGAWVIFVQADPPDRPAVALYDKLGVREEVLHFDIPVAPPLSKERESTEKRG